MINRKEIKKRFVDIMQTSINGLDVSVIRKKYLDWFWLFKRFYPVTLRLKKWKCKSGIDFGCGTGGLIVLSSLIGIKMVGVDTSVVKDGYNRYNEITSNLTRMGFDIRLFDTSKYPWDFGSNSMDVVTAFQSIKEDYTSNTTRNHLSWNSKIIRKRIKEISRIVKPRGVWYVGSNKHYYGLRKSDIWSRLSKKQNIVLWRGSGEKRK